MLACLVITHPWLEVLCQRVSTIWLGPLVECGRDGVLDRSVLCTIRCPTVSLARPDAPGAGRPRQREGRTRRASSFNRNTKCLQTSQQDILQYFQWAASSPMFIKNTLLSCKALNDRLKISFPLFHWKPLLSMLLICLNHFKSGAS